MATVTIRSIDDELLAALRHRAAKEGVSANSLAVQFIEQGLGLRGSKSSLIRHDDLDALAGTWSIQEGQAFNRVTAPFSTVDHSRWK
jgi:hypothetical protein